MRGKGKGRAPHRDWQQRQAQGRIRSQMTRQEFRAAPTIIPSQVWQHGPKHGKRPPLPAESSFFSWLANNFSDTLTFLLPMPSNGSSELQIPPLQSMGRITKITLHKDVTEPLRGIGQKREKNFAPPFTPVRQI